MGNKLSLFSIGVQQASKRSAAARRYHSGPTAHRPNFGKSWLCPVIHPWEGTVKCARKALIITIIVVRYLERGVHWVYDFASKTLARLFYDHGRTHYMKGFLKKWQCRNIVWWTALIATLVNGVVRMDHQNRRIGGWVSSCIYHFFTTIFSSCFREHRNACVNYYSMPYVLDGDFGGWLSVEVSFILGQLIVWSA